MGAIEKLEVDVELKSVPSKVWEVIRDSPTFFPKLLPHHYKSIEILEGVDHVVGSIRLVTYADGNPIRTSKEKIEVIDDVTRTLAYSVIDGDAFEFFKSVKAQVAVEEKGEGSLVKWLCEFEKAKEEDAPITPENLKDFAIATFQELDEHLLKAN